MAKRKRIEHSFEAFIKHYDRDILKQMDLRFLALMGGYYIDYLLDKKIEELYKHPEYILELSYFEKLKMLKAVGYFDAPPLNPAAKVFLHQMENILLSKEQLYKDLIMIAEVRNFYAHNIIDDVNEIPEHIKSQLLKLPVVKTLDKKITNFRELIRFSIVRIIGHIMNDLKYYNQDVFFKFLGIEVPSKGKKSDKKTK